MIDSNHAYFRLILLDHVAQSADSLSALAPHAIPSGKLSHDCLFVAVERVAWLVAVPFKLPNARQKDRAKLMSHSRRVEM